MSYIFKALLISLVFVFVGCQKQVEPPVYKWGNYVKRSAEFGMNGHNKEVLEKHLSELDKIIRESKEEDKRVAPGIYAEYAQLLFQTKKTSKAKEYFEREKTTYPESSIFINRVLKKLYGENK